MNPALPHLAPPDVPERKVYVNASLRFESVQAIGFDMDYTLAVYDETDLERLAFELAAPHLAEMGYPPIAEQLQYRPGRGIRGLVADLELGNVLKVDQYDYVSIAWHGIRELDQEQRRQAYRNQRIDLYTDRYESVDTLFALPNLDLYSQLVALRDARPQDFEGKGYRELWSDVRSAIDQVHQDDSLKKAVMADPGEYLIRDPELPTALQVLRDQGKKLFLLTNSGFEYTDAIMGFLLDGVDESLAGWADFFDLIVVDAAKPAYFEEEREGRVVAEKELTAGGAREVRGGGNFRELHGLLDCRGEEILFVGDHIFGDVIRSKRELHWRTLMILPELGDELVGLEQVRRRRRRFLELVDGMEENDNLCARLRNKLSDARVNFGPGSPEVDGLAQRYAGAVRRGRDLQRELDDLEGIIDRTFHPRWGALMNDGGELSRFGKQVLDYSDLYTSRVPNLSRYPPGKYFQSPWDFLPHSRFL